MKNKTIFCALIIMFITIISSTFVYANSNQIKLEGEFKQMNSFFDGEYIKANDFIINTSYLLNDGSYVNITNENVAINGQANINNQFITYNTAYGEGTLGINVLPFNSNINYENFVIPDMTPYFFENLDNIKKLINGYVYEQLSKITFTNNNNKRLIIDPNTIIADTSNLKLENGNFTVSYKCGFYNNNVYESNKYDTVTGMFNVVLKDFISTKTEIIDTTLSLSANKVYIDTINMSYDININNLLDGSIATFISNDIDIATVNYKSGLIKSVSNGITEIVCKIINLDNTINTFIVNVKVGSINTNLPSLSETQLNLYAGDIFDLGVNNKIKDSYYKYKTSNSDIVSVKALTGKGMALSEGIANIYLTVTTPEKLVIVRKCKVSIN